MKKTIPKGYLHFYAGSIIINAKFDFGLGGVFYDSSIPGAESASGTIGFFTGTLARVVREQHSQNGHRYGIEFTRPLVLLTA